MNLKVDRARRASQRAEQLLLEYLTPEQRQDYKEWGGFNVRDKDGKIWRIVASGDYNIVPQATYPKGEYVPDNDGGCTCSACQAARKARENPPDQRGRLTATRQTTVSIDYARCLMPLGYDGSFPYGHTDKVPIADKLLMQMFMLQNLGKKFWSRGCSSAARQQSLLISDYGGRL